MTCYYVFWLRYVSCESWLIVTSNNQFKFSKNQTVNNKTTKDVSIEKNFSINLLTHRQSDSHKNSNIDFNILTNIMTIFVICGSNVAGFILFAFVVLCIFAFRNFAIQTLSELRNFGMQIYAKLQIQTKWNQSHSINKSSKIVIIFVRILNSIFEFLWLSDCLTDCRTVCLSAN